MPGPATPPGAQIFGRRDSRDTQKAIRFFRERRLPVAFVDLAVRPPAPAELRRFSDRFGAAALVDREGRRYRDLGMAYMRLDDREIFDRLLEDPSLLRLPLVRYGQRLAVGVDEQAWRSWLQPA